MNGSRNGQPELRLGIVYGMASDDFNTGLFCLVDTAAQDVGQNGTVERIDGKGDKRKGGKRRAGHCINVRERIGGGHLAEAIRIIHDRRKEIRSLNDGKIVSHAYDGGIVARIVTHEHTLITDRMSDSAEDAVQVVGADLTAAARPMREIHQPDGFCLSSFHTSGKQKKQMQPSYKIKKIDDVLNEFQPERQTLIDVRSPSEFAEDHIPGAVNLPVLSDEQRAMVGTMYRANSFEARHHGAALVSANIAGILPHIEEIVRQDMAQSGERLYHKPQREFILYCWRGGMRSSSLFVVMDLIGYRCFLIEGGYRSYRRLVNGTLYGTDPDSPASESSRDSLEHLTFITIHGPSGSGKSELLHVLREHGFSVLDLERYANHKGSLLGGDFQSQPSQKAFESLLWNDLHKQGLLQSGVPGVVFVEGESRKIGRLALPGLLYEKMCNGEKIWAELPVQERAVRLAAEYAESDSVLIERLTRMKSMLSGAVFQEILSSVERQDRTHAALLLLNEHYDRYYRKVAPEKVGGYTAVIKEASFDLLQDRMLRFARERSKQ